MQHKDAASKRWVALIVIVVAALNLYWAASLFAGPSQINPGFVVAGVIIQLVGIAGAVRKLPDFAQKHIPGVIFIFAILFGASMEWFGLFHGHEKGRVSPSVWAPSN